MKKLYMLGFVLVLTSMALLPGSAAQYTLTDKNATFTTDIETQAGTFNWIVEGTDHLYQQWWWYRVGSNNQEYSVDTLNLADYGTSHIGPGDPTQMNYLWATYQGAGFQIDLSWNLKGGGIGSYWSDISEVAAIKNTGSTTLDFHLFEYNDFDLSGTSTDDVAHYVGPGNVHQQDCHWMVDESTPGTSHWEIDTFANTRNRLNDALPTTLSDASAVVGPADVTWAFQWDFSIAPGATKGISKNKILNAVPEATTVMLGFMGLTSVAGFRRLRRK